MRSYEFIDEAWSSKYKRSINCSNPKGFSQKAHCAGRKKNEEVEENFADGRNPQDKGDSKRHGINTKASVSSLRRTAKQGGRKGQLAHWLANMKAGRAKKEDFDDQNEVDPGQPINFPAGTSLVDVSDVYDWYKLGQVISDLDDADPRMFNQGVPHTVIAMGSEEEEAKIRPLLQRLGFNLHDIDKPGDVKKAMLAKDVIKKAESLGEGWKEADTIDLRLDVGWAGVENTPDGVLVYAEDVVFNEDKAWLDFIYNLTTGEIVKAKVRHDYNGDYDYDWDEAKSAIDDIIDDVRVKYGSTWDEINDELHGGVSVDEGWKDWVAGAAIGAAALGGAGDAEAAKKKPTEKPAIVQQAKADPLKQISKKEISKTVTGNPHEALLKKAAQKAGIQGEELAAFLSQCAHETMDFKHMKEIGGKLDFKKYDIRFAPSKAKRLGNTQPGDGAKYSGRGYIQLTGKYNYAEASKAIFGDDRLVKNPSLVEKPEVAAKTSVWFWQNRVSNKLKNFSNVKDVTKGINPGMKHLDQRQEKFKDFKLSMR